MIPRVIDEIPLIALAGAAATGRTVIRDAGELRVKESDRLEATATALSRLGAQVDQLPDGLVIEGGRRLRGGRCSSHGDHRIAMMLGVAGLISGGTTTIDRAEAADVSYSGFWRELRLVAAR
jgi:3-phosphoshikimate 1-carboxyvinyltransferase